MGDYTGLMIVTMIYVLIVAIMDIVSKEIYTTPSHIISVCWISYMLKTMNFDVKYIIIYCLCMTVVWAMFNIIKPWGAGDTDMLMLTSNVLLAVTGMSGVWELIIFECIIIILTMIIAIIVGCIEIKMRKEKVSIRSKVAVVPGFAAVIILLLLVGLH